MTRKTLFDSLIGLLLGGLLMLLVIYGIPKSAITKFYPEGGVETAIFLISVLIGPFFAIFLHELGHLAGGLIQGYKVQLFVVAFFGLKREQDKVKFFFNTDFQYFGGVAASSPTIIKGNLKRQFALILAMGPLFSLVFALIFFLIYSFSDTAFNSTCAIVGLVSFGLCFATTIPARSGIFFTDRKRLQRLFDKGKTGQIEQAMFETTTQMLIDGHSKNLDLDKIRLIQTDEEAFVKFLGSFFEYAHYKDLGLSEQAAPIKPVLDTYRDTIPKGIWKSLELDQ